MSTTKIKIYIRPSSIKLAILKHLQTRPFSIFILIWQIVNILWILYIDQTVSFFQSTAVHRKRKTLQMIDQYPAFYPKTTFTAGKALICCHCARCSDNSFCSAGGNPGNKISKTTNLMQLNARVSHNCLILLVFIAVFENQAVTSEMSETL